MKIFLIFSRKLAQESSIPPYGIMYIAAMLRKGGFSDLKLYDLAFHQEEAILRDCAAHRPDVIGLSSDSISFERGAKLLKTIKNHYGGGVYLLGGVHPTIAPEQSLLETQADAAILGEGELTAVEVVKRVEKGGSFSDIKGVALYEGGRLIRNEPRSFIRDLDDLPLPARDLLPMDKYLKTCPDLPMLYPTMTLMASRGCKANCLYCQPVARTLFGKKMRHRSVANVLEEIIYLKKNYTFKSLYFIDDELLYNGREWVEELCTSFIRKNLKLNWVCQARVDQIDEDLVVLMKKSGCYAIGFGVESGSQKILNYMRKGYRVAQIEKAFDICRRHEIVTTCNFMVGTPGETHETIQESLDMLSRIRPNLIRCSITTPTPGSDLHVQMAREQRINIEKLSDFDRWAAYPIVLDNFSKEDIQDSIEKIVKIFYRNFFRTVFNPLKLVRDFYFIKILLKRYSFMLTDPARLLSDISFYIGYKRSRKGRNVISLNQNTN